MKFDLFIQIYVVFFSYIIVYFFKSKKIAIKEKSFKKSSTFIFLINYVIFLIFIIVNSDIYSQNSYFIFFENDDLLQKINFYLLITSIIFLFNKFIKIENLLIFNSMIIISQMFFFEMPFINQFATIELVSYIIMFIFLRKESNKSKNYLVIFYNIIINFLSSTLLCIFLVKNMYFYGFESCKDTQNIRSNN